jgi:hypothetical protein
MVPKHKVLPKRARKEERGVPMERASGSIMRREQQQGKKSNKSELVRTHEFVLTRFLTSLSYKSLREAFYILPRLGISGRIRTECQQASWARLAPFYFLSNSVVSTLYIQAR